MLFRSANIATKPFQQQFEGKHIMRDGTFASVAVMKIGQVAEGQDQVDAISGGTITSKGVETMLRNCIGAYSAFLNRQDKTIQSANEGGTNL